MPASPSVTLRRLLCCASLLALAGPLPAQEANDAAVAASAPAASANALSSAFGSLFGRIKAAVADERPAAADAAASAPVAAEPADAATPGRSEGFSVIDIESWSRTSDVVLDPQCKTLVQPFGLSDNAASLALLAGKLKLKGFMDRLQGSASQPLAVKDIVKLAARHLNWLPMEAELALGQSMLGDVEILDEAKNKDTRRVYAEARAVLADVVRLLPAPLPYDFQIRVLTKSNGNAAALPGGIVLVDRDLFKKGADRDFAHFVIAHEVAHVLQRHETRVYQARLADGIDSVDGLRKLMASAGGKNPAALLAYGSALKKLFVDFTEQQELQADSCAVRLMAQHYPDSRLLAAKLAKVEVALGPLTPAAAEGPRGKGLLGQIEYLGDGVLERHPHTQKRRSNLQATFTLTAGGTAPR